MTAELRDFIGEDDFEGFLHPQRKNMVGQADVAAGRTGDGWRDRAVFVQKFPVRASPMVTAVARQYCVPRMRVHHSFGSAHDTGNIREASFHLPFQFSRLDVPRIAGDLDAVTALSVTPKNQRMASFVILRRLESYTTQIELRAMSRAGGVVLVPGDFNGKCETLPRFSFGRFQSASPDRTLFCGAPPSCAD